MSFVCETELLFGATDDLEPYVPTNEEREDRFREDLLRLSELPAEIEQVRKKLWQVLAGLGISAGSVMLDYVADVHPGFTYTAMGSGIAWAGAAYHPYDYLRSELDSRTASVQKFRREFSERAAEIEAE